MNTREIVEGLIEYMEKEIRLDGIQRDIAAIQAYATLILARRATL